MRWNEFVFLPGMILTMLGVLVLVAGTVVPGPVLPVIGFTLIGVSFIVHIVRVRQRLRESAGESYQGSAIPAHIVQKLRSDSTVIYEDRLVRISGDSITFLHYSFPFFTSSREVLFQDIDHIDIKKPAIRSGKWRIGGSGDFRTWYPFDGERPSRDRIFHASLTTGGMNIGFTVEHPEKVIPILRKKGLIASDEITG
jgi:hypothetical protein